MALLWIIWGIGIIGTFAILEGYAIDHPTRQWTLSHAAAWLGSKWPLTLFLTGLIIGGLAVHFWGASWNCGSPIGPQ